MPKPKLSKVPLRFNLQAMRELRHKRIFACVGRSELLCERGLGHAAQKSVLWLLLPPAVQ